MLENIELLTHSSIRIVKDNTIYFDPYKIDKNYHDADYIFLTHNHYDHFSPEDIKKVITENTIIIAPSSMENDLVGYRTFLIEPNNKYNLNDLSFETIPSYNRTTNFHPKKNNWVGYILTLNNVRYYISGDTDLTDENKEVKCDVAFLPIGGTFTMNPTLAAELTNIIKPKYVIPTHYGSIIGKKEYAIEFRNLVNEDTECLILMKY